MNLDIPVLVAPLSDAAPSGPDLSYDDGRVAIEAAFERSVSNDADVAETTDWADVIRRIVAQAEQTRDVWLPVYLMRAATFARRFDLLVDAAEFLAALLEERWDDVHPQLDEYGFIGRKTPCESLTRIGDFLSPLSRVPLLEHPRFGRFSGSDIERFADEGSGADGYGAFHATVDALDAEAQGALVERFDRLRAAVRRADSVLTLNAQGDTGTNFKPTYQVLDRIRAALVKVLPVAGAGDAGTGSVAASADAAPGDAPAPMALSGAPGGPTFSGAIRSRADVVTALDAICAYYAACEPASPVPFILRRAREWTTLDFMAVLEDIAPGSLDEAGRVLRSRAKAEAEGAAAPAQSNSGW